MFDTDKCYIFNYLGTKKRFNQGNLIAVSEFRFRTKNRRYFVIAEHFDFNVVAIKYCDVNDKNSKKAYGKMFKDFDGFKVIATCIKIMHFLWEKNKTISFAFYAVPRDFDYEKMLLKKKCKMVLEKEQFIQNYKRARFNIYEHAMINLFPPQNFFKIKDWNNCIYVLLNKKTKIPNQLLNQIGKFLQHNHQIIFEPTQDKIMKNSGMRIG